MINVRKQPMTRTYIDLEGSKTNQQKYWKYWCDVLNRYDAVADQTRQNMSGCCLC